MTVNREKNSQFRNMQFSGKVWI